MERKRIQAWMREPGEVAVRDGLALLRAYHVHDAEGIATLLENCNHADTLKAVVSLYEVSLIAVGIDPCNVLESISLHVIEGEEG